MPEGTVSQFDPHDGAGLIRGDDGREWPFHRLQLRGDPEVYVGARVWFEARGEFPARVVRLAEGGPREAGRAEEGEEEEEEEEATCGSRPGPVTVRALRGDDLEDMVAIDERVTGRSRGAYLGRRVGAALRDSALMVSLVAEVDGRVAGFLLATLYYGEFGLPEPGAVIDTIGVDPRRSGQRVGTALVRQLETNLRGLGIQAVTTEVAWDDWGLLRFLGRMGFAPSGRLCLERRLGP
ncbi:MAG: GNAT family N-acetyltransferase [Planctomycetes bacterium]|nr:GNAT family N-acetyltransferase [Planctomycetota bacterium]